MPTNLFAQAPAGPGSPIVQFRAGKMTLHGNTVTPDKRKGLVQLVDENGALVLKWTDRGTSHIEDTIYLFPGQATYARVPQCKTGRVFLLNFLDCNRQAFFWMQEPKDDKDAEYCEKISSRLALPAARRGGVGRGRGGCGSGTEIQALQQLLAQQNAGASPAAPPQQQQLLNLLRAAPTAAPQASRNWDVSLVQLLSGPEVLAAVREDENFYRAALQDTLPPGGSSSANFTEQIRNPQVSSTAGLLQEALRDPDGFRELSTAFGIGTGQVPRSVGVLEFLEAILRGSQTPPS